MATIWIAASLLNALMQEAVSGLPNETGGVLLGYWDQDAPNTGLITDITGPGPEAIHKRTSFIPDYRFQEEQIRMIYEKSGRVSTYLGDWHTHPGGSAKLSLIDRVTLHRIANFGPARARTPLMSIVIPTDRELAMYRLADAGRFLCLGRIETVDVVVTENT